LENKSAGNAGRISVMCLEKRSRSEKAPRSGYVVRPRGRRISTVKVRVGECHIFVAESNCVAGTIGPQQNELDSAVCHDEPSAKWRCLKITDHASVVAKAMIGYILWLEVERWDGTVK